MASLGYSRRYSPIYKHPYDSASKTCHRFYVRVNHLVRSYNFHQAVPTWVYVERSCFHSAGNIENNQWIDDFRCPNCPFSKCFIVCSPSFTTFCEGTEGTGLISRANVNRDLQAKSNAEKMERAPNSFVFLRWESYDRSLDCVFFCIASSRQIPSSFRI